MPRRVLMSALVTRAQQLADMEGDTSISATEWKALMSEAFGELYEDTASVGLRYWETVQTYTTDGSGYLTEPSDQLAIVDRLELVVDTSAGRCRRLRSLKPQERAQWSGRTGDPRAFELVDDRYYLYPTPTSGKTLTLRYIAQCPDLTTYADSDIVDCVTAYGQRFVVLHAAGQAVSKSQRDPAALISERENCRKHHMEWASDRAFNDQPTFFTEGDESYDWLPTNWDW